CVPREARRLSNQTCRTSGHLQEPTVNCGAVREVVLYHAAQRPGGGASTESEPIPVQKIQPQPVGRQDVSGARLVQHVVEKPIIRHKAELLSTAMSQESTIEALKTWCTTRQNVWSDPSDQPLTRAKQHRNSRHCDLIDDPRRRRAI